MNVHPTMAQALKPYTPSKCFKCPTIDHRVCMIGEKCIYYDKASLDAEIERRRKEREKRK